MKQSEKELEDQIKTLDHLGASKEELEEGAKALAAAVGAIQGLQTAIKQRCDQANLQIAILKSKQESFAGQQVTVHDAIDHLSKYEEWVIQSHAIWFQTEQQCGLIRMSRDDETLIRTRVMDDVLNSKDEGYRMVQQRVNALTNNLETTGQLGWHQMETAQQLLQYRLKQADITVEDDRGGLNDTPPSYAPRGCAETKG